MKFGHNTNLDELIVRVLAAKPNLSAAEIHDAITSQFREYTPQALYKELNKLQELSIVVRLKQRYSLTLSWTSEYLALSQAIQNNYGSAFTLLSNLPAEGKRMTINFSHLIRLKNFWSQLVLALSRNSSTKLLLSWNPHPLFYLTQSEHQTQLLRAMKCEQTKMLKMVGGRTPLDKWAAKFWDRNHVEYSYSEGPFEDLRSTFFWVLDNFVVTISFDQKTTKTVEQFFNFYTDTSTVDHRKLCSALGDRVKSSMKIEHNPEKARSYAKKFSQFFGVKIDPPHAQPSLALP